MIPYYIYSICISCNIYFPEKKHYQMNRNIFFLVSILFLASCSPSKQKAGDYSSLRSEVVKTAPVEQGCFGDELTLNGDVSCDESLVRKIFIPCSGRLTGLTVEVGDAVRRGQILAIIHSEEAADYNKGLADADAQLRIAEREYEMKQDMHRSGMASDKEVSEAHGALVMARAERRRLGAVAGINGFGQKATAVLRSLISGYVIAKNVYNDSYVSPDGENGGEALEIANLSRVWVIADVYESDIARIHQGDPVTVTTMAYDGEVFHGQIDKVYNVLDSESKTMKVRVTLDNARGLLRPGMFATVHVSTDRGGKTLSRVPASAIVFDGGKDYVIVDSGNRHYRRQVVKASHVGSDYAYVASGLRPGELVVSKNALLVFNTLGNE
jgi:cobalt-zinc-cadmium efflux system membrane fusion protein